MTKLFGHEHSSLLVFILIRYLYPSDSAQNYHIPTSMSKRIHRSQTLRLQDPLP